MAKEILIMSVVCNIIYCVYIILLQRSVNKLNNEVDTIYKLLGVNEMTKEFLSDPQNMAHVREAFDIIMRERKNK